MNAPYSDADTVHPNDLLSYVSAMRRREDAELIKLMPALRMVDLNLKDAPLRLRRTPEELHTLPFNSEDTAIAKIQKALLKLAAEQPIGAIMLPLALGHHVDHVVVRNAALAFASEHACAFYEDLPDALETASPQPIDAQAEAELTILRESNTMTQPLQPVTLSGNGDPKAAATIKRRIVSIYASQIEDAAIDAISNVALQYGGSERAWANPAWLALSF